MKTLGSFLVSIALLAGAGPAFAQVYKWVDATGRTHYSDKAPQSVKKVDTVIDRVSTYSAPETPATYAPPAATSSALDERVDRLERQLYAERMARQQAELAAAYAQPPQDYYYYPVAVANPGRGHGSDRMRRFQGARAPGVVGPGIMPGTFNGPNAITAGNVTLRTSLSAGRGRGAASF